MKFTRAAIWSALVVVSSLSSSTTAFTTNLPSSLRSSNYNYCNSNSNSMSALHYTIGIVGATGAVGKEIRTCLENRGVLNVDSLRIFGSSRSAGTTIDTKSYGSIEVELFDVEKARQCDVIFLAVDGDFALKYAREISAGDDGAVVIDNSVSYCMEYNECGCGVCNTIILDHSTLSFPNFSLGACPPL